MQPAGHTRATLAMVCTALAIAALGAAGVVQSGDRGSPAPGVWAGR